MSVFSRGLIAASLVLAFSSTGFAATARMTPQIIKVSLLGEAGQPMSVKLDTATLRAGAVEFDVSNDAIGTDHEVILVKLDAKGQIIKADKKNHRVDEAKLKSLGEVGGLKPGKTGVLKAELTSGKYMLICNHKSHFELGMATPITVTN